MSKIDDLADELRKLLAGDLYPPGARFPSEYELMERYNVARLTANKAVAVLVTEGLLERGGRGSGTFVRRERRLRKEWIAVLADITHPHNAKIVAGAARTALQCERRLSVFNPDITEFAETLQEISRSDCIGVLTMGYGVLPADFPKPVVYLDNSSDVFADGRQYSITCDNYGAALEMMTRVLEAGYREVVTVTMPQQTHRKMRFNGFNDGMKKYDLVNIEKRNYIINNAQSRYEVLQIMRAILRDFPDVEYIVTDSDDIVLWIIEVCNSHNISCPGRIKLSGFGNIYGVADIHHLPTVEQHSWHIGCEAVRTLLEMLNNPQGNIARNIQLPAEVVNTQFI